MRNVAIKVYRFDELSESAQENALHDWHKTEYPWHPEVEHCLREFLDLFGFSVYHWEYDSIRAFHRQSFPDSYWGLKGPSAREWFKCQSKIIYNNNCPLTGYYLDEVIMSDIRTFLEDQSRNDSIADVLTECVGSFFHAVVSDVEYYYSFESFAEHCDANDYEFLESGEIF